MRKALLLVMMTTFCLATYATAQQEPIRLMRYPDVANGKIAFCYQGDLWLVEQSGGRAMRLTVHHGDETYPKFSPDGKWIAFTGNYFGGSNVFIIPVDGGQPKQLTYHPSGDIVRGWTPDSKYVIFSSSRTTHSWSYVELFKVSIDGRYPEKLPVDRGDNPSLSPDGTKMAFSRHPSYYWWWKRYKGTFNQDIWIYDFEEKTFQQITKYEGNDSWPMWGKDNNIYFVSDRNGIANIFAYMLLEDKQITKHTDDGVQWPSMSPDGKFIVYENNGRLYLLDTVKRSTKEVVVYAPSDDHFDLVEFADPKKHIWSSDISPSGKRVVFNARGEVFTAPAETGDIRNLTKSARAREQYPVWSPNGKHIAYISDVTGEQEVYIVDQKGKEEPVQLTDNGKFKFGLKWSPDSKKLLYHTNNNYLYMVDVESKEVTEVAYNPAYGLGDYNWSPDSKWIAYSYEEKNYNADIHIYSVEEKKGRQFTEGATDDRNPIFTPDGKTLVYLSEPIPGDYWFGLWPAGADRKIQSISLKPEEEKPYEKEEDEEEVAEEEEEEEQSEEGEEEEAEEAEEEKPEEEKEKEEKEEEVVVEIDFENVMDRVRVVPVRRASYWNLQATKDHYYFLSSMPGPGPDEEAKGARNALYAFEVKKVKTEKIIDKIYTYKIAAKGKKILTWDGDKFQIIEAGKKDGGDKKTAKLDGLTMKIDRLAEWEQIFHEGWRMVRDHFYDENYHGVDWEGVREHYASLLPYVRTRDELNTLMAEMVGELNASHQGVGGGDDPPSKKRYSVAMLGAQLEPDYEAGYYRFTKIYQGDKSDEQYRSPLDADYVKIKQGDYLLAINSQPVPATENYLKYLVNQHQNHLTLTTNSVPSMEDAVETRIKPITDDYQLRYKEWLDRNTQLVDESSGGKIGYIHLENMGGGDLDVFRKYLEAHRYKEGIILDVRYNGGGGIDDRIIDILERRQYHTLKMRDSVPLEHPANAFYGKVVVLCNEYSFSDAEMFPSAFKVRGLGTLIGKQTLGYVIAVTGHRLMDGGYIRKSFVGIWEVDGTQLEGTGAVPDITVENPPEDEVKGKDAQLEKAISYLMEEIERSPRDYDYPIPIKER